MTKKVGRISFSKVAYNVQGFAMPCQNITKLNTNNKIYKYEKHYN